MGLGLAGMLAEKIKGKPKGEGNTSTGAAVGPAEMSGGNGASGGYAMPQTHLGAAPTGVGHQALVAQAAPGHYAAGMASAAPSANPALAGPPAPVAQAPATSNTHQALRDLFSTLGKSGQIGAQTYQQPGQPAAMAPVAQMQPIQQMQPHLGLSQYFLHNGGNGGMA